MKKIILSFIAALGLAAGAAHASSGATIAWDKAPNKLNDLPALQNGAKLFVNYCVGCHSAAFMRYKLIHQFCAETGYTDSAVRAKIRDGIWLEGREYRKSPDGHIQIDIEGYYAWVETSATTGFARVAQRASKLTSSIKASAAEKPSGSPQPLRI